MTSALAQSPFGKPLLLDSAESEGHLEGDIDAVVEQPFARVAQTMSGPQQWCEVLILQLNTKSCRVAGDTTAPKIVLEIGRKDDPPTASTFHLEFVWRSLAATPRYFSARLDADSGPLNTHDYRIDVEAVALEDGKTFLHLDYGYSYGVAGRLALQGYLATAGRGKVGFTTTLDAGGKATAIAGVRGIVERNTMRYYLAVEACLSVLDLPRDRQLQARLERWYSLSETYARQLHELDRETYLADKLRQVAASGMH